jgi:phage terminase large subunit-like protein
LNGKTRTGCEWIRKRVYEGAKRIALIAPTAGDVRDVLVEGESGIMNIFPPKEKPIYEPSKRRITFHTGAIATTFSADQPERLRGPQHDTILADELASWRRIQAYDMALFGLRLGNNPRMMITTTPKPIPIIKKLMKDNKVHLTTGSTFENEKNLAKTFIENIKEEYSGTRLGQQELFGKILDDLEGALWKRNQLEELRVNKTPDLKRIVVAIDPAVTNNKKSDETGIIVAGLGTDGHGYILDDLSLKGKPSEWANEAITAYYKYKADYIVAETNNGGDLVGFTISTIDAKVPFKKVHASRGKFTRAEPVSSLYDQKKIHHVGYLGKLEDQMCNWLPTENVSPDRLDALVWSIFELMLKNRKQHVAMAPDASIHSGSTWKM